MMLFKAGYFVFLIVFMSSCGGYVCGPELFSGEYHHADGEDTGRIEINNTCVASYSQNLSDFCGVVLDLSSENENNSGTMTVEVYSVTGECGLIEVDSTHTCSYDFNETDNEITLTCSSLGLDNETFEKV